MLHKFATYYPGTLVFSQNNAFGPTASFNENAPPLTNVHVPESCHSSGVSPNTSSMRPSLISQKECTLPLSLDIFQTRGRSAAPDTFYLLLHPPAKYIITFLGGQKLLEGRILSSLSYTEHHSEKCGPWCQTACVLNQSL